MIIFDICVLDFCKSSSKYYNSEKWMTGNVLFKLGFEIIKQDLNGLSVIQLNFWCFIVSGDCKMEIGRM